ncbi:MAG: diacylglycerol kinase family protein [Candidatus Aminicenantes bacterium]|nr:diacylglycerol kinase family protein [Candidatus Aminicenantes bacterium]
MPAERISILYNPSAGMGRALRRKLKLEQILRHLEVRYDLIMSRSETHLRELTREHAKKYGTLVGAGGDSTFHIMINEIMAAGAEVNFGLIGVGSSNDITLEFGVDSLEKACRTLKGGRSRKIDLGCIREGGTPLQYFLGQANIGLGAFVNIRVAETALRKPWLAKRQTLAGILGIRMAYRSKSIPLPLKVDAEARRTEGDFVAAIFSNVRFWAMGKIIAPGAVPDDGQLDACLIRDCSFLRLARISRLANAGRHAEADEVEIRRAPAFEVASDKPFEIQSDGEIIRTPDGRPLFHKVTFSIVPQALNLICP